MRCARYVTLGTGQQIGLGQYVSAIKLAKDNRDHIFEPGLASGWPATGEEIVQEFRRGVQDRINLRGRINVRALKPMSEDRKYRHLARTQECQCRMCGASISWRPMHGRFCDACCRTRMRINPRATYLDALLRIIVRLAEGPATSGELMKVAGRSRATLTREIRDAKDLGVVIGIRGHKHYEMVDAGIFDLPRLREWAERRDQQKANGEECYT